MTPCNGCKFLVKMADMSLCSALDSPPPMAYNPFTKRMERDFTKKWGFRPDVLEMRSESGKCGPGRSLYKPSVWRRILNLIEDVDRRNEDV